MLGVPAKISFNLATFRGQKYSYFRFRSRLQPIAQVSKHSINGQNTEIDNELSQGIDSTV
jgi:hypothetical protein